MLASLDIFLSLTISFTIAYIVIPKIITISRLKKLFDVPNHRSAATQIVPTLGGIAILAGFAISNIVSSNNYNIDELKYLYVGIITMFMIGLKDDIIGISAKTKLFIEIIVAIYLVVLGDYRLTHLHGIFGINEINYLWGFIISVIAIVGIINAVNMIDGIDGLAGGMVLLASMVYGFWFLGAGDQVYAICSFSLSGSLIAFLLYNVFGHTNKIFMGDTGSLVVGIIIALLTLHFNLYYPNINTATHGMPAISLAIIIVPVVDTIRVVAIRIWNKRFPFSPDMNHIHHNLLRLTKSHLISTSIILFMNALIIGGAFLLLDKLGNNKLFFLILLTGLVLAIIPDYLVKWYGTPNENKTIFAFSIFIKKFKPE